MPTNMALVQTRRELQRSCKGRAAARGTTPLLAGNYERIFTTVIGFDRGAPSQGGWTTFVGSHFGTPRTLSRVRFR